MIKINELVEKYRLKLSAPAVSEVISRPASTSNQALDTISWIKNSNFLATARQGYFIVRHTLEVPSTDGVVFLFTEEDPKLVFSKILADVFERDVDYFLVNDVETFRSRVDLKIADNVFIGQDVEIGAGTVIFPNVVIEANTVIGENCVIKSHVSLGTEGLGLSLDKTTNKLVKFPQLGNVVLGDNVDIGPHSTVRRAAIDSTLIGNGTKIGSLVNIGHNCVIGENCIFTSQIVTSGSSKIGDNVFMGVCSMLKNGKSIGSNVTVGMGAVVVNSVPDNVTVVGNPSRILDKK